MKITKVVEFCAAHSIRDAGKCANKHGHNWVATIEVELFEKNDSLDHRGFIVDVADLKQAAFKYDHDDLDNYFMSASTENVAQAIADDAYLICQDANPDNHYFITVHLQETRNNSAEAFAYYKKEDNA